MSATYLDNRQGFIQFSGIITDVELNNLGTTPYIFNLPANFAPFNFAYIIPSGSIQQIFTSDLIIQCISTSRNIFGVKNVFNLNTYYLSSYINTTLVTTPIVTGSFAFDQDLIANNYQILPQDGADPTPGDYFYKYTFTGFYLF